tara:strand:+ start:145 stop:345 length:201 start_codon:yes stop_codon:yes gene_type:complete
MSRFGDLVKGKVTTPAPEPIVEAPKRARDNDGHFIADDPSTPENEAWVGGVSPSKKKTKKRKSAQG